MQVFLELSGHPKANIKRVRLAGNTVIGRSKKCGLQIASPSVSRKHCEIRLGEETAVVIDLGSSNGTFVASERISAGEEHPLPEGTRLNVGGIRFLVSYTAPSVSQSPAPAESDKTGTETPLAAAAAAPAAGDLLADDEPLSLDEGDSLLGFEDQSETPAETPAAESTTPDENAPLSVDLEDEAAPPAATREASVQADDDDDAILGEDSMILANDESVILVDDDEPAATNEPASGSAAEASGTESSPEEAEVGASDQESFFEESEQAEEDADDALPGDIEDDEPILVFDESDEPLAEDRPSESRVNLEDSATYFGDTDREETADEAAAETESRPETKDDEDIAEAALADDDSSEDDDEAALVSEQDEDDAFAFLDDGGDDDDDNTSKANKNDSELGDFLSQLGRD